MLSGGNLVGRIALPTACFVLGVILGSVALPSRLALGCADAASAPAVVHMSPECAPRDASPADAGGVTTQPRDAAVTQQRRAAAGGYEDAADVPAGKTNHAAASAAAADEPDDAPHPGALNRFADAPKLRKKPAPGAAAAMRSQPRTLSPRRRPPPIADDLRQQCKPIVPPDWLGGTEFQSAALSVAPVTEPGEWSHSDKTTRPMDHHSYESMYEKYLGLYRFARPFAGKAVKLLEIGIGPKGTAKGFRLYKEYLPTVEYYGFEIQNQLEQFATSGVLTADEVAWLETHVMVGNQSKSVDRIRVQRRWGPFDIIVDDGSHMSAAQIATFRHLFLDALKPGGTYIVEDLETSFQPQNDAELERLRSGTAMSFVKFVADLIYGLNFHWWNQPNYDKCVRGNPTQFMDRPGVVIYPDILSWVQTIDCDREICVFRKRHAPLKKRVRQDRAC